MRPSYEFVRSVFETDRYMPLASSISNRVLAPGKSYLGPLSVDLTLSDTCQHKCPFCVDDRNEVKGPIMRIEDARRIINQLAQCGVRTVNFDGGGEPLIGPFAEACRYAHSLGMECGLITNGALLHLEKNVQTVLDCCSYVRVSLDASNGEMHEERHGVPPTGNSGWNTVTENVRKLVDARDVSSTNGFPVIGLGYLVDERSYAELDCALMLSVQLGVDYIAFRPMHDGTMFFPYNEDDEKHRLARRALYETMKTYDGHPNFPYVSLDWSNDVFRSTKLCMAPRVKVAIGADGRVYTCCNKRYSDDFCLGRMTSNVSFNDVWTGAQRAKLTEWLENPMQDMNRHCNSCNSEGLNRVAESLVKLNPHRKFLA